MAKRFARSEQARQLGPMVLLRLRAEVRLQHDEDGAIPPDDDECGRLDVIAVAPKPDDREFLGGFNDLLAGFGPWRG
jgi:hypothetical protein